MCGLTIILSGHHQIQTTKKKNQRLSVNLEFGCDRKLFFFWPNGVPCKESPSRPQLTGCHLERHEAGPFSHTCLPWHHPRPIPHIPKPLSEDARKTLLSKQPPEEAAWDDLGRVPPYNEDDRDSAMFLRGGVLMSCLGQFHASQARRPVHHTAYTSTSQHLLCKPAEARVAKWQEQWLATESDLREPSNRTTPEWSGEQTLYEGHSHTHSHTRSQPYIMTSCTHFGGETDYKDGIAVAECRCRHDMMHRCQPSRNRAGNPAFLRISRIPAFFPERPAFWLYYETQIFLQIVINFGAKKEFFS